MADKNEEVKKEEEKAESDQKFADLEPFEQKAIELRYRGYGYAEIADKVMRKEGYLRTVFCKGGRLYPIYQKYKETQDRNRQERFERVQGSLDNLAMKAVETIEVVLGNNDAGRNNDSNRLKAAQDVLDRTIGKPTDKVDLTSKGDPLELLTMTYDQLLNARKKHEQNPDGTSNNSGSDKEA